MLYKTQAMAGIIGNKRASPRLSPSAIWAICWAARAESQEVREEKMAPASAVLVREDGRDEEVSPFGRFWTDRREMGFDGFGLAMGVRALGLRIAIVAMVAAIAGEKEREERISSTVMTRSERKKKTKPKSISNPLIPDLPEEIIAEILSFLPVKTLIKFRCVSKSWLYLISNPKFINTHLIKSSNSTNFTHHRLIFTDTASSYLYSCSLPNSSSSSSRRNNVVELDYPFKDPHRFVSIVGSCNGLLCITIEKVGVFIWNPSVRKSKELPNSDIEYEPDNVISRGFGYDQLNDDYKVVRMVRDLRLSSHRGDEVKIYSLKKGSWGKIGNFPLGSHCYDWGKYANGKLHWTVTHEWVHGRSKVIVSLDLGNETYGEIAQPCYGDDAIFGLSLGVLEGCLSFFCHYNTSKKKAWFDIWVMKEYDASDTWIKLYTIPIMSNRGLRFYCLLRHTATGEILLKIGGLLRLYNPNNGEFRDPKIKIPRSTEDLEATTYVESLVSPNINDEVPNPQR